MTTADHTRARLRQPAVVAAVAAVLLVAGGWWLVAAASPARRQAEVAERGAPIMGFDIDATVHRFTITDTGGVQQVLARDPADTIQTGAVRAHLTAEADRFAAGDFTSPAAIHGADMPGLAALSAAPTGAVEVAYDQIDAGAQLTFTTTRPELVDALHTWFNAQLADHGDDAEAGAPHEEHHSN